MTVDRLLSIHLAEPYWLLLLLAIPLIAWLIGRPGHRDGVPYSSVDLLSEISERHPDRWGAMRWVTPLLVVALVILAVARPRIEKGEQTDRERGIDLMLVLDLSKSMEAQDFILNGEPASRLDGLNHVTHEFIDRRPTDRIGVIGFSKEPYLVSPLTLDHIWVKRALAETTTGFGTAIGSGMVAAARMLDRSDAKTKVQIVITDGINNRGVPPLEAAELADQSDIRIYTIEILRRAQVRVNPFGRQPLREVATLTGGQFFQATDVDALQSIYTEIDRLETSLLEQRRFVEHDEVFVWLAIPAVVLLGFQFLLDQCLWLRIP